MNTTNNDACREAFCKINKITAEFLQKELSDGGSPWHSTFNNYSHGYQAALASVQQSGEAVGEVRQKTSEPGTFVQWYVELPAGTKIYTAPPSVEALQKEVAELKAIATSDDGAAGDGMRLHLENRELRAQLTAAEQEAKRLKENLEVTEAQVGLCHEQIDQIRQQLAQPAGNVGDVYDPLREGIEIIDNLIASIEKHGNYTVPSTVGFLSQVRQCFTEARALLSAPVVKAEQLAAGQVPDLAKTLREVRESLQFANDSPNGPINDTIWMMHIPVTLFDYIDNVLLSAAPVPSTAGQVPDVLVRGFIVGLASICKDLQKHNWPAGAETLAQMYSDEYGDQTVRESIEATIKLILSVNSSDQACTDCGQLDSGQTGEYPCKTCGLPTVHDEPPQAAPEQEEKLS